MSATLTRRLAVAAAAEVVLAGAAWWTSAQAGSQAGDRDLALKVATATAAVTRRNLRATEEVDGTLGYGRPGWWPTSARAPSPPCPPRG